MLRLRFTCSAALLLGGCVFDSAGVGVGAGTTSTTTSPASTSTGEPTTGGGSTTTTGEPAEPPTSSASGPAEPETTTGTSDASTTTTTGATTEPEEPAPLSFEADIQPIFADYCTCHGDGKPDPDLGIGRAWASIVGRPSDDVKGMDLVAPGATADSYLWHKIAGSQDEVGGEGKRMPPNDELQPGDVAAIQQWIADGALP
ncbi:hypothetical protein [Nannocystis bainbridge]|uniref:Cytochrome c domain-containing protein n=1 Tax=Nannocystis bainbridge TaxID=2995303 RepID=A0ABT5DVJ8_9BACT|nr:hypothetical protein [Nannocystis bainbridge]MDC0716733.1 hypothetical protein [Nannocystis bainbridge]